MAPAGAPALSGAAAPSRGGLKGGSPQGTATINWHVAPQTGPTRASQTSSTLGISTRPDALQTGQKWWAVKALRVHRVLQADLARCFASSLRQRVCDWTYRGRPRSLIFCCFACFPSCPMYTFNSPSLVCFVFLWPCRVPKKFPVRCQRSYLRSLDIGVISPQIP